MLPLAGGMSGLVLAVGWSLPAWLCPALALANSLPAARVGSVDAKPSAAELLSNSLLFIFPFHRFLASFLFWSQPLAACLFQRRLRACIAAAHA